MELEDSNVKFNLVEAVVASLKRLNSTINEIKKWTFERASLQSDIYKLQVALYSNGKDASSILLSQDPLVKYQTQEIRRLEFTNSKMKTQLQSLSDALLQTKKNISFDVNQKIKNKMAEINNRIEEEKQQLIKEIDNLKIKLEDNETVQQLKIDINAIIKDDSILDNFFSKIVEKSIITIKNYESIMVNRIFKKNPADKANLEILGNQSINPIIDDDENDSEKLEYMSCYEEQELRDINFEHNEHEKLYKNYYLQEIKKLENDQKLLLKKNIIKEKALKRSVSTAKIKLTIALMKNKKLDEKIKTLKSEFDTKLNSTQTDLAIQTEEEVQRLQSLLEITKEQLKATNEKLINLENKWDTNNNYEQLEKELTIIKNFNNDMTTKLNLEQTTAKEALKLFNQSTKDIERLETELEDIKIDRASLQREMTKLKLENGELKNLKISYKKKNVILGEEGHKQHDALQIKIKRMKLRINKLEGDSKILNMKNRNNEEIINELGEKNKNFQIQNEFLLKNSEETLETLQKQEQKNFELKENIKQLKMNNEKLIDERQNLYNKLEISNEIIKKRENDYLYLKELSNEINELNDNLKKTIEKNLIEINDLTSRINDANNESLDLKSQIATMTLRLSDLQLENEQINDTINISKAENEKLTAELLTSNIEKNALKSQLSKMENEKNINKNLPGLRDKNKVSKDEIDKSIENSKKNVNEDIEKKKYNKLSNNYEKVMKKNLYETEKELSVVKSELVKIKHDIGSLKSDLDNNKYGMYELEKENIALKEELAKLRTEKLQLLHKIQKTQTAKKHKIKEQEVNVVKSK